MKHVIFTLIAILPTFSALRSQSVNAETEILWAFDLGTDGQTAVYTEGTKDYFGQDYVTVASNLNIVNKNTTAGNTYTQFQPLVQNNSLTEDDLVTFVIKPKKGLTFLPSSIEFDCMRFGTDGGKIDVLWMTSDGVKTTLQTGIVPNRNNNAEGGTHVSIDLSSSSIAASADECRLLLYIYSLGNTKQAGLADIKIKGSISGTLTNVNTYKLITGVIPAEAGAVANLPGGSEFDEGTTLTLTATRNFGYHFSHWADSSGNIISTDNPYTFNIAADTEINAVFNSVETYELKLLTEGGAKDYMISLSPAPTMVSGKMMYEISVKVTLIASDNPVLHFTNWKSGETNPEISVEMTENKEITAVYSALDYIAGWDFYYSGNGSRSADFYSDDNQGSTLILRTADGNSATWLDKSQVAAGGYEGRPAAVNWKNLSDRYYYQLSVNASDFTDISAVSSMLLNYNAYSVQQVEYSTDGVNFTKAGEINLSASKTWFTETVTLPSDANHSPNLYIRWIPDYSSPVLGTEASNDGTAISDIFILGTKSYVNDGTAPALVSSIPANSAIGVSTSGKIVLNFDEKVQLSENSVVTLRPIGTTVPVDLSSSVSGKTITFSYSGLYYNSDYEFILPANSVSDLGGNKKTEEIKIVFTTITRQAVQRRDFDFIVGRDGDLKAALQAAKAASSSGNRFYIFLPDGEYNMGELTGDANQMTTVDIPNLSIIGQSREKTVLYNRSREEGIGITATIHFTKTASNLYLQDLTILNKMDYRTGTLLGRGVALRDQGSRNIYKNVNLLSNQDTYYTGDDRSYLENCEIHGTVDFICGGGDIYFNECLLYLEDRSGNCITAPSTKGIWGYVFNNCTIDGFQVNNNSYRLGRPWNDSPKAVYLNTTMKVLPVAAGWGDPMGALPSVFAEYNSLTAGGSPVDLSARRTSYTYNSVTVIRNPVLTADQAGSYTLEKVLGGTDNWQPTIYTDQAKTPEIYAADHTADGITTKEIFWADDLFVLCWAVFKDDVLVTFVTSNSYMIQSGESAGKYTVRAVNEMGGLGEKSNVYDFQGYTSIAIPVDNTKLIDQHYFTIDGRRLAKIDACKGVIIVRSLYSNGKTETKKIINY
jgi:pectin methylesterase-like acyl-CoA thioesterase